MKKILFLVQKEFLQVFRDRFMLILMFIMPIVQLLVLVHAATYDIRNIKVHVIDHDRTNTSQKLVNKLEGSKYFQITGYSFDDKSGYERIEKDKADLILKIPAGFARDLVRKNESQVQVLINAINGTKAGLGNAYINHIIADFNGNVRAEWMSQAASAGQMKMITIDHRNWYNPSEDYKVFMVPGILVSLVTLLSMFLSALNIVREKEIGTIEQLNVTTIGKYQFIIGKLIPFGIIALVVLALGLFVARFVFDIPFVGSLPLLFAFATLYIITGMGLGICISNISSSQQQAMFTMFFFMMIFILMSGLFTPIESMPAWAQKITLINPLAYFIKFMRMVLLKGSEFQHVSYLFIAMGVYALAANTLAIFTYRKTVG